MNRQQRRGNIRLVPVSINGKLIQVNAAAIAKGDCTPHHGQTAAGVKVNSARSYDIGDSSIVWASDGAPATSFLKTDLEVFAKQKLEALGFQVTKPQ
ncbi:hypothetical protein A2950_00205 [Candidatus Kaiserbacteria bacterium RIFCSPLOWO2_01_FULL_55_19]|uniref:Uncharacterized protein n=1 Tax=Candidatus Kaiserbacteria bacterium RIFCSPLOWO2_01_FULL_55_19 TaxID=1798516 RepID=A0A1F6ERX4_9BACT|nr:MAG: hypothetical protein A2950_00205 [Candidatus Kaiserbacteria bacterium RIFCSPLOWO2_01_FULL_55_19]